MSAGRLIGRHQLQVLNLYPSLSRNISSTRRAQRIADSTFSCCILLFIEPETTSEVLAKILGDGLRMAVELKPQQSRNPDMMQTSADLVTDPYSQESTYRGPLWQHDD